MSATPSPLVRHPMSAGTSSTAASMKTASDCWSCCLILGLRSMSRLLRKEPPIIRSLRNLMPMNDDSKQHLLCFCAYLGLLLFVVGFILIRNAY